MNRMIIDTETANGLDCPLPYDVGYIIFDDETGEELCARSFIVKEIFSDDELMASSYYARKIPQYVEKLRNGEIASASIVDIRRQIAEDCKFYAVKKIGAYNMGFDSRATRNDIRYISGSLLRWFFPYGIPLFCIWNMACTSILRTEDYIFWAMENGLVSGKLNIQTSAEAAYQYITRNNKFIESHTGLEDVRIEKAIFMAIRNSKMAYDESIKAFPWRKVANAKKIYYGV
jgi:hypothetical protein